MSSVVRNEKGEGMIVRVVFVVTGRVCALLLGGVFLWQVAEQADPRGCEAVVHVTEADVDVWVDRSLFRVEGWNGSPIVCEIRPGRHLLRMFRHGRLLYEESFTLGRGEGIVLTAWDTTRPRVAPGNAPGTAALASARS
jgi:hypothetical protein